MKCVLMTSLYKSRGSVGLACRASYKTVRFDSGVNPESKRNGIIIIIIIITSNGDIQPSTVVSARAHFHGGPIFLRHRVL